jgi:hypothetical protein
MRACSPFLLSLLPALAGCAGNVSGSASDAETATTTSAVVVVERASDATEGSLASGSARFVRVAAPASVDDALRAIGAFLELPATGTCADLIALSGRNGRTSPVPVVELVDVGAVWLEVGGISTHLLPRQLPDVTDVVSGVVYARAAEPALLAADTGYVIHVAGGRDLAAFQVRASAPEDPSNVRIAGENDSGVVTVAGSMLDFSWSASADASNDLLYVDTRPDGIRCVFDNVGHAAVPTSLLGNAGTIVVHRLHRDALRAPGVDSGEVRFDFSRAVGYVRP